MRTTTALDATKLVGTVDNARISLDAAEIPNLDAAKITSGDIALARLGNVPPSDTTSIQNDISLIALQSAINGNLTAYGLKNSWIEQFEDSTKIENLTQTSVSIGEYIATIYSADVETIPSASGDWTGATGNFTFATGSVTQTTGNRALYADWSSGTGDFTVKSVITTSNNTGGGHALGPVSEFASHWNQNSDTGGVAQMDAGYWYQQNGYGNQGGYGKRAYYGTPAYTFDPGNALSPSVSGDERRYERRSGVIKMYYGPAGSASLRHTFTTTNNTDMRFVVSAQGTPISFTSIVLTSINSSAYTTGSFNSTDVTPSDGAAKSSVGLVILYKDEDGVTTLDNDIIAKVRANTGQAYQTVALRGIDGTTTPSVTYSNGMKVAIAPAISVTSGTALSYEISFANQALSSKEARIYGVAMTY